MATQGRWPLPIEMTAMAASRRGHVDAPHFRRSEATERRPRIPRYPDSMGPSTSR